MLTMNQQSHLMTWAAEAASSYACPLKPHLCFPRSTVAATQSHQMFSIETHFKQISTNHIHIKPIWTQLHDWCYNTPSSSECLFSMSTRFYFDFCPLPIRKRTSGPGTLLMCKRISGPGTLFNVCWMWVNQQCQLNTKHWQRYVDNEAEPVSSCLLL